MHIFGKKKRVIHLPFAKFVDYDVSKNKDNR